MADITLTPLTAPVVSIANTSLNIDPIEMDIASAVPMWEQINATNTDLANQILAYIASIKLAAQNAINSNNTALINATNTQFTNVVNAINGLTQSDIEAFADLTTLLEKYKNSDLNLVQALDKTADEVNALYRVDALGSAVTVSTLTVDGANGAYHEIAFPIATKSGKSLADLTMIDVDTLSVKIDRSINSGVEVKKIDTSDNSRIRIYFQSRGIHFAPQTYDTSATWGANFTFGLTFGRKLTDTEKINVFVPVVDSTTGTGTTSDQPVGAAN